MCGHVDGGGSAGAGQCCAGTGCCGSGGAACQTVHDAGLNATYYDCDPLNTYDLAHATTAAQAWSGTTVITAPNCPTACVCTSKGVDSAVWCYASPWVGLGNLTPAANCFAAQCPVLGTSTTFTWH
jgi:hypothetical protein